MFSVISALILGADIVLGRLQIPREPSASPCQLDRVTPQFGPFGGLTDTVITFGLDAQNRLVQSSRGVVTSFNASFENCPALGPASITFPAFEAPTLGRIVLTPSIGGPHTCLTVVNPGDAGTGQPLFAQAQACTDDTTPSSGQIWIHGFIDDFGGMFWVGDSTTPGHGDGYGILERIVVFGSNNQLITDSAGRIELALRTNPAPGTTVLDFEFL